MKARRVAGVLASTAMILVGIAVLLYPTFSEVRYAWSQRAFAQAPAKKASARDAGGRPMPKGAVAKLVIDSIDLDAYVVEGTDQDSLSEGPGHYEETPLPGEHSNSAIAGHRTMHGHPFRRLDELAAGDKIVTYTASRQAIYKVVEVKRVDPTETGVIAPTKDDRLTLTTCNPVGSARQRLVVVARMVN